MTASLRSVLRSATHEAHMALDARVLDLLEADNGFDADGYRTLLRALRSCHEAAERRIGDAGDVGGHGPKAALAAEDLAALGHVAPDAPVELPAADTPAALAGVVYVVEGSTLGGMALVNMLPMSAPRAFLTAYGSETARRWRCTVAWIEQHGESSASAEAAMATFEMFASVLRERSGCAR